MGLGMGSGSWNGSGWALCLGMGLGIRLVSYMYVHTDSLLGIGTIPSESECVSKKSTNLYRHITKVDKFLINVRPPLEPECFM